MWPAYEPPALGLFPDPRKDPKYGTLSVLMFWNREAKNGTPQFFLEPQSCLPKHWCYARMHNFEAIYSFMHTRTTRFALPVSGVQDVDAMLLRKA